MLQQHHRIAGSSMMCCTPIQPLFLVGVRTVHWTSTYMQKTKPIAGACNKMDISCIIYYVTLMCQSVSAGPGRMQATRMRCKPGRRGMMTQR